jgi:RNase P subunit RPR2
MTTELIQYTWTEEERRKDRIKHAFYEAYEKYTAGYMKHIKGLVKTCSNCHNETIKPVNVSRNDNGLVIVWKCQICGRIARTFETEEELLNNFKRALKKH